MIFTMAQISFNIYPSKINGGLKKITQHAPIGQRHLESRSHEKGKHVTYWYDSPETELYLYLTEKGLIIVLNFVETRLYVTLCSKLKNSAFPDILPPFLPFFK